MFEEVLNILPYIYGGKSMTPEERIIQRKIESLKQWKAEHGGKVPRYLEWMDACLLSGTDQSRKEIVDFFHRREIITNYLSVEKMAVMSIFASAYEMEISAQVERTIFDIGRSVNDLKEIYLEIKLRLWRMEFGLDASGEEMGAYCRQMGFSSYVLLFLWQASSFDKEKVMKILKRICG